MDAFTTPVDATITPWGAKSQDAYAEETLREQVDNLTTERDRLSSQLEQMTRNWQFASDGKSELTQKIKNVEGKIRDIYSEDGEIDSNIEEIAELLDITLTKRISGTASFEISWSADVPIGFDADDFEISFDVDCESYEADNFDWQEENTEVNGEDDY